MKKKLITVIAATMMVSTTSAWANTSYEYAPVIDARPVYQQVRVEVPEQHCWNEQVAVRQSSSESRTPLVVGTIIGGALGNAVGNNKSSRRVGTVAGAALGASIGRDIGRSSSSPSTTHYQTVQHCENVSQYRYEERVVGYQVRYRYNGQDHSVRMNHDPGERIRLRVHVQPVL
jgi:uncharacterized protein YcfJ